MGPSSQESEAVKKWLMEKRFSIEKSSFCIFEYKIFRCARLRRTPMFRKNNVSFRRSSGVFRFFLLKNIRTRPAQRVKIRYPFFLVMPTPLELLDILLPPRNRAFYLSVGDCFFALGLSLIVRLRLLNAFTESPRRNQRSKCQLINLSDCYLKRNISNIVSLKHTSKGEDTEH